MTVVCCSCYHERQAHGESQDTKKEPPCAVTEYCKNFFSGFTCFSREKKEQQNKDVGIAVFADEDPGCCNNNTYTICGKTERRVVMVVRSGVITHQPTLRMAAAYPQQG